MSDNPENPSIPSEYLPRWLKAVVFLWPVLIALSMGGISLARSDSQLDQTVKKVETLEKEVKPLVTQVARVEERQIAQSETLRRVEDKLDRVLD